MKSIQIDGDKVRAFREVKKFTLAELAARMEVSRGFVHLLEKGKTGISREKLNSLVATLGVDEDDLLPREINGREPKWLRYLDSRHSLSDDDKKLLKRIVRQSGIPSGTDELMSGDIESVWEEFYRHVQSFLSNPNQKFFDDDDVKSALVHLGLVEPFDWCAVRLAMDERLNILRNDYQGGDSGAEWLMHVTEKLRIHSIDLSERTPDECIAECRGDWSIIGGVARVASSPSIYGAIYRRLDGSYSYIGDSRGRKSERGDYPLWHEIARVYVDPELKLGRGSVYFPDGEEMPPFEKLLCRVASWLAFGFLDGKDYEKMGFAGYDGRLAMNRVNEFKEQYYPRTTTRMAAWALIDVCKRPMMYVDAYLRMKEAECKRAGIKISDIESMAQNSESRLRIGFVAKNIAGENSPVSLRFNLRVMEGSCLGKSFYENVPVEEIEDFSQWDRDYNLCGKAWASPMVVTHGVRHVKAILNIQEES